MTPSGAERRGARRVDANLSVQVTLPAEDGSSRTAVLKTVNISTSGVYFRSEHFIEPLTKLALELELEVPAAGSEAELIMANVPCEGMVVRTIPEVATPDCGDYEVAVFFTHMADDAVEKLEQHIAVLITREN